METQTNKNNTWKWIVGVIAILLVIYFASSSKTPSENTTGEDTTTSFKVGAILPLTGDAAVYGEPIRNVVELAVKEINTGGGVNGKNIEMIFEDGQCAGEPAVNAMQKLVNVDKVQVVLGGFCSSESLAATPVATANKVLLFSAGSSSPDLTGISTYFFRNYPSDASQGEVLAGIAYNDKKWKKVAFIQEQTDYALGIYKAFKNNFEKLGGTVTKEEFPTSVTDFRSSLTKLKASSPDALFVDTQTPAKAEQVLKQIQELKWKVALFANDAITGDIKTVENNKAVLEGALAAEFGVDMNNTKFKNLLTAYKDKFGSDVPYQSYAQTAYDAVYVVRDGILAVGYDGAKLAGWSRTIKDWDGASGKITIGTDGDRVGGHTPKVIKNGNVELYIK